MALCRFAALRRALFAAAALTGLAGAAQATTTVAPFSNLQPSLVLNEDIALSGNYPNGASPGGDEIGFIYNIAGYSTPTNTAQSLGQLLSITQNTALFSLIGTTYGGDGVRTFALPNLSGRLAVGSGAGVGLPPETAGQVSGSPTVTITQAQLPPPQGSGQPFNNVQPSLGVQTLIDVNGIYPSGDSATFIGEVANYAGFVGQNGPTGWMPADGRLLPIAQYQALFSIIGTTYGGDGRTTFALPDLQGRVVVGADAAHPLGSAFGQDLTALTQANLQGTPVNNDQASLALRYLIAINGVYPGGLNTDTPVLGEVVAWAGTGPIPTGYVLAEGQLLPINQYAALFSLLGTTYGGDGVRTFELPNLDGRAIMGSGGGYTLGELLGADQTTLSVTTTPPSVPEPSAWALMLLGLAVLGLALRRARADAKAQAAAA